MRSSRPSLRAFASVVLAFSLSILSFGGCGHKETPSTPSIPVSRAPASSYAGYNPNTGYLSLGNGLVEFRWSVEDGGPAQYIHKQTGHVGSAPGDFQFQIGDVTLSPANNTLEYTDYSLSSFPGGGRQLTLHFAYGTPAPQIEVLVEHAVVPSLPGFRKQIRLRNLTDKVLTVGSIQLHAVDTTGMTLLGPDMQPLTQTLPRGMRLSALTPGDSIVTWLHEAPSRLKYWTLDSGRLILGLPPEGHPWQARIRLVAEDALELPAIHSVYQQSNGTGNTDATIQQYTDRFLPHVGTAREVAKAGYLVTSETPIPEIPEPPDGVDLIIAEHEWDSDEEVLERLGEMESLMHRAGLRFGLQVSLALYPDEESVDSGWSYQLGSGQSWSHARNDEQVPIYCLASDYALFIGTRLSELVERYQLDALLLTGPVFGAEEAEIRGCHAFNHDHYGVMESAWEIHKHLALITEFLHHQFSSLLLITTEEFWGAPISDESVFSLFDQVVGEPSEDALWQGLYLKQYRY